MHPLLWVPSPETLRKPSTRLANSSPSGGHWRSGNWAKPPENEDEYQLLGASHLSGSSRIDQPGIKKKKGGMYIMNHNDQYNPRNIRRSLQMAKSFPIDMMPAQVSRICVPVGRPRGSGICCAPCTVELHRIW